MVKQQAKSAFQMIAEMFKSHFYLRLSTASVSVIIIILGSGWIGIRTMARTYAGSIVIYMVRPVTDSINSRINKYDSDIKSIYSFVDKIQIAQKQSDHLAEITIAAQRKADPKFDKALHELAKSGDDAKFMEEENRQLILRLTESRSK